MCRPAIVGGKASAPRAPRCAFTLRDDHHRELEISAGAATKLVEFQPKVATPSWAIPEDKPADLYRISWRKHPDTPDEESVNIFAKFRFKDTGCLYASTEVLLGRKFAFPKIQTMSSEARIAATSADVPFHLRKTTMERRMESAVLDVDMKRRRSRIDVCRRSQALSLGDGDDSSNERYQDSDALCSADECHDHASTSMCMCSAATPPALQSQWARFSPFWILIVGL